MTAYGVYIHQDIEAVLTETFVMTFRRVKSQDALEACLLQKEANSSQYSCIGICRSLPATALAYPVPRKDDVTEREKSIFSYRYGINGFEKKTQAEVARLLGISRSSVSRIQRKVLKTVHRVIPKLADQECCQLHGSPDHPEWLPGG